MIVTDVGKRARNYFVEQILCGTWVLWDSWVLWANGGAALGARQRHDGEAAAVRQGDGVGLIEENGAVRLDGQDAAAGEAQRLHGGAADGGHVEAHVLLRLGHLDDGEAAGPAQLASAENRAVG